MVWFFEREQESLRLHTTFDNTTQEFVATVTWSHGRSDQTRFSSIAAFRDWLKKLEMSLEEGDWRRDGPPLKLSDQWPDERFL